MQHSKKMKKAPKEQSLELEGHKESKGQSIEGDSKVSSNLRSRSRLYWLFSCCGSTINIQNTYRDRDKDSEDTDSSVSGDTTNMTE